MLGLGLTKYIPILVYITSILVLLYSIFYRTEVGIYFLVALLPIQNLKEKLYAYPMGKDIVDVYIVVLLLCWFFKKNESGSLWVSVKENKGIILYALLTYIYLLYGSINMGIELPFALDNVRFLNWKNHIIMPILYFIILNNISDRKQIYLLTMCIMISVFLVGLGFKANLGSVPSRFHWERRTVGVFTYLGPNEMAAYLANFGMIFLAFILQVKNKLIRLPLLPMFAFLMWCLLFTWSRGAYLAVLICTVYLAILKNRKLIFILLFLVIFWKMILPSSVIERINMTVNEDGSLKGTATGRVQLWKHGINLFIRNPIGYGYDTVQLLGFHKRNQWIPGGRTKSDTHNKFIEMLVEMGLPGILIFVYLFISAFLSGWLLFRYASDDYFMAIGLGFCTCVVSAMIVNFFGDRWTYIPVSAQYWAFWGITVRARLIVESEKTIAAIDKYAENTLDSNEN